jgi:deoxyribodipyrimidine photolyase
VGVYVRRWVPELRHVPIETREGQLGRSPQLSLALYDTETYAEPVVDHATAARAFLRRYREFIAARV